MSSRMTADNTVMSETIPARPETDYSRRARYFIPANIFKTKRAPVPRHVFITERDRAFDEATATGLIDLDLSDRLELDFPATTPLLLVRYARIRAGESLSIRLKATGEVYYVIRGSGETSNGGDTIAWQAGDVFCLPGGAETTHRADAVDAVLFLATNEPELAFERAEPPRSGNAPIQAVHYPAEEIQRQLDRVLDAPGEDDAAGKAVQFCSKATEKLGTCLPSIALAINSLEPGQTQRPHRHNAVALTLCLQGENCYSIIEGERVDWRQDAVMVTPPTEVHSHHNEGNKLMKSLIVQDGGIYYHARTVGFSFEDAAL